MIIKEMDRTACLALLHTARIGRLACALEGQPYIVPVSLALDGSYLDSFSLAGKKVEWMRQNAKVCVHIDDLKSQREWRSVVIYGSFEELPDRIGTKVQRERAWSLLSQHAQWWEPGGLKPVADAPTPHLFYRIHMEEITGRQAQPT